MTFLMPGKMLKKSYLGAFQRHKLEMRFTPYLQNQGLEKTVLDFGRPSKGSTSCFLTAC